MRTHIHRRGLAVAATVLSASLILVACGSDEAGQDGQGGSETTEAKDANVLPGDVPSFTNSSERLEALANEGCAEDITSWVEEAIIHYTEVNEGNAEYVDVSFDNGPVTHSGHKTCKVMVKDAQIEGTIGGDLNNFELVIGGLTDGVNVVDKAKSQELTKLTDTKEFADAEPADLNGLNAAVDDALMYANTNDLTDNSHITINSRVGANSDAQMFNDTSGLSTTFTVKHYGDDAEGEDTEGTRTGWVAGTTSDPQIDTSDEKKFGNLVNHLTMNLANGMANKTGKGDSTRYDVPSQK